MVEIFGGIVLLAVIWLLANIIRALAFRMSNNGGFWGLYHYMVKDKKDVVTEKVSDDKKRKL